jgi:glycosyltransferase involved in cell wall biosynthesis
MHLVQVNYVYADTVAEPDALLDRFHTLTGWSEAVLGQMGQMGQVGRVEPERLRPHRAEDMGIRGEVSASVRAGGAAPAPGNRVSVVQRFSRDARVKRNGVEYHFCREPGGAEPARWSPCAAVARTVAGLNPDVVHVNGLPFHLQTWWLASLMPSTTAVVVQDHAGGWPRPGAVRSALRRRAMARVDAVLFSALEQAEAWTHDGIPSARVRQVLESSTSFQPQPRDDARSASGIIGSPAILWVGRLNANKDPLVVLDAFERTLERCPDGTLTMVFSESPLLGDVRARLSGSTALALRVRLAGEVPHRLMPAYFSAADLFVLGSHHEVCGYALLEAMACGAVPIVTDIPSFRMITANGSVGRLWPPGDAAAAARALVEASRSDAAGERARVLEHFDRTLSWRAVGERAVAIYDAVSDTRARAR